MKTNRSLLHISDPSDLGGECKNTNCRFHDNGVCQLMTDPGECETKNQMEPEESPWHKDYPNSTPQKRVDWDNSLTESH